MSTTDGLQGGLAVLLVLTVVLGSVGVYVATVPASAATTRVVDAGGGTPYKTIQAALDASDAGDTVEVRPGVYREAITVTKEVTLVAPNGATLNGSTVQEQSLGAGTVGITVDPAVGSGLTIDGFTVERYTDGITVGASAMESSRNADESIITGGWTIRDVTARDNAEDGVDVGAVDGTPWTMTRVTAVGNGDVGIEVDGYPNPNAVGWTIRESNASDNGYYGVYTSSSMGRWRLLDSTTNDNGASGVQTTAEDSAWVIGNHTASGNADFGIHPIGNFQGDWTIHNATVTDNGDSGIGGGFGSSGDWTIRDSVVTGNYDWGLYVPNNPGDFRIENVTVRDNSWGGIAVTRAEGNWRIDDSRIENNGDYRGYFGVNAEFTLGSWAVNNTVITGNVNGGINAEEGRDGRPVGDATDNWWGQASGPLAGQCVGNVDCGSPLTAPPGTTASPAVVSGTVTNDSGVGLAGVEVAVYRDDGTGTFTAYETNTTDAAGQYRVDVDVPAGETTARFKVEFEDPSGVYLGEWYDDAAGESTADTLDVQSGFTAFADAELADNTATVYGRVRNESGDPIEGILVVPYREDAGGDLRQLPGVGTDATGQYTYEMDVPPGQSGARVKLLFADPDDVYASRYYDDAETLADGLEVYVPAGERRLVSGTLPREADVTAGFSGTVTDGSGAPLSDIDVAVFRDDGTGTFREWTTESTDSSGEFDVDVDPVDSDNALVRVKLRFTDPSGQYTEQWYDGASQSTATVVAGLVSAERADLNATLVDDAPPAPDVARVSGWVTNESGAPIEDAFVNVYIDDGTGAASLGAFTFTSASGQYAAEVDLPAGESSVDVKVEFTDTDDVYASRYYDDATRYSDATAVTVPGGETRFVSESLPVADDVTGGFSGTVTNESGDPLPGIEVTAFRDDGTGSFRAWTTESTDAQGRYDIDVEPANPSDNRVTVKLRFTDPTWEYAQEWNSSGYQDIRTMADATEISALVGDSRVRNEELERNVVTVSGVVRNEAGDSLEDILVVTYRKEADGGFTQYDSAATYTDEFGRYETEVPVRDGETTVDLKVGFADPDGEYARTYWRDARTVSNADVIDDAVAGWTLPNVMATMPRRDDVAVTYFGIVYDENNDVLEDIRVTVFRDDGTGSYGEWTNLRTDENGYWEGAVYPPPGEQNVSVKIRYRDDSGDYLEEWESNESSKATADVESGTVGEYIDLIGTVLAPAPKTQVSGVVRADTDGNEALDGIRVTAFRDDGTGDFDPFATLTTDEFGYYEFQVPPPPGSSTVSTRLYFRDPTGEYSSMWYRDARRAAGATQLNSPAGEGNYFNDQWLPEAGMLLGVSVQALSTCQNPADESSCTFPNDEDTVTVGPGEEVAVHYELWNGDDEVYTDYDVDDPATGTTMFGANHRVATLTTRTTTTTLTSPLVDGSYDYQANATSISESGKVSNSSASYTIGVQGSVVQQARAGDRFDASVSNPGAGTPVLVDGGTQGLANLSNTTFQSVLLTTDGGDFSLNLTGSDDAPSGTSSLPLAAGGTSLGYVTVDHSVPDENVDEVVFRFRVSRLRLATAGVSPGDVTLYRYVDGSPTALSTALVRTTPTASVFEATSPGLSVFAVGAGELTSTPADSDGGSGSADTDRDSDDRESPTPTPVPTPVSSDSDATVTPQATETPASESTTATGGVSTAVETSEPETSVADSEGTTTVGADATTPTDAEPATTSTTFDGFGALTLLLALFAVLSVVLSRRRRR
ncbi:right-handed parallel beta-helix repeat-containing protein [Salinigranum marinum]|uniref:right-handed parallel beta-helix repeat-containing protein n=1 Tax=Salinigranum marinum TaxID=1515595 RepID=UPI002989CFA3|nr:right-handed parallel beta-helix repeat-containing protein [Salinigranum marinum]